MKRLVMQLRSNHPFKKRVELITKRRDYALELFTFDLATWIALSNKVSFKNRRIIVDVTGYKDEDGILHFKLSGKVNSNNSEELLKHFEAWIAAGEKKIAGDLSGMDYITSAGLRCFVYAAKQLSQPRSFFILHSLQESILNIMHLTGLINVLTITVGEKEAVEKIMG